MPAKRYFLLNTGSKCVWRQRWIVVVVLLSVICTVAIMKNIKKTTVSPRDTYHDDVSKEVYHYVMDNWFNYTGADRWYNNESISMFDAQLLETLREHWIVRGYNDSTSYYGSPDQSYSEDPSMGQAQVIKDIFNNKKSGFFIECGAYDGVTRSNTLSLERDLNWTGILIEADPINFTKMLNKNRRAYLSPTCLSIESYPINVSFLMARNIGRIHVPHESHNSTLTNTMDRAHEGTHVGVQCFPLASYIAALNIETVDYFSLDVEGNEMDILKTIPFDLLNIETLSVEFTHVDDGRQALIDFMDKRGYFVYSFVTHKDNLANDIIFIKRK